MAENRRTHRLARAASRAARSFQENQKADDARIAEKRARLEADSPLPDAQDGSGRGAGARPAAAEVTAAARRAAQGFQERQRADDARLKDERARLRAEDEQRLEARAADRARALDERDAAEAGLVHPLLRLARAWWLVMGLLLAALAGAFVWRGMAAAGSGEPVTDPLTGVESVGPLGGATGQYMMGGVAAVLALLALWGWIGLLRRSRGAVSTLTFLTVLVALPAFLRGNALLIMLAALLIVGTVLVWLPPVRSRVRH